MNHAELTQVFRILDRDLADLYYRLQGWNNEVRTPFVADDATLQELNAQLRDLTLRVEELPSPDRVYGLMQHHFQDFLAGLRYLLEEVEKAPEAALLGYHYMIPKVAWLDDRADEFRCQELITRYEEVIFHGDDHLRVILQRHSPEELVRIAAAAAAAGDATLLESTRLAEHFPTFTPEQHQRLRCALENYAHFLDTVHQELLSASENEVLPDAVDDDDLTLTNAMDHEQYRALLSDRLGVDLDELLAWHREEMAKTRRECLHLARALNLPDTDPGSMAGVCDILFRFEPPCATGEEMHARCNEYLKRTRELAHRVIRLPEEELSVCVPIPRIYADGYPWGGYEGGDFRKPPYIGKMFLNQFNTPNITDGWIKLNALHESYPGHHCQFVRTAADPLPETVKIGSRLIPLLEGTCLRTESVYGGIFDEDPVFPLFTAYRRHHASVRICVDLMLYYYGQPLKAAVDLYQRELGFDYTTARAQVRAHQTAPGYFTGYYYGMKKICQWELEYGYPADAYTELLISAGFISMDSFHLLVQMSPEEQRRYFCEFSSLFLK